MVNLPTSPAESCRAMITDISRTTESAALISLEEMRPALLVQLVLDTCLALPPSFITPRHRPWGAQAIQRSKSPLLGEETWHLEQSLVKIADPDNILSVACKQYLGAPPRSSGGGGGIVACSAVPMMSRQMAIQAVLQMPLCARQDSLEGTWRAPGMRHWTPDTRVNLYTRNAVHQSDLYPQESSRLK
jgi:hypothetical protein